MNEEIQKIVANHLDDARVGIPAPQREWLSQKIAANVAGVFEQSLARLKRVANEEFENRGNIQRHINRAELPWETTTSDDQADIVGKIVASDLRACDIISSRDEERVAKKIDKARKARWEEYEDAIKQFANPEGWKVGGDFDANSHRFIGLNLAQDALKNQDWRY